jgi:hypothetical protein
MGNLGVGRAKLPPQAVGRVLLASPLILVATDSPWHLLVCNCITLVSVFIIPVCPLFLQGHQYDTTLIIIASVRSLFSNEITFYIPDRQKFQEMLLPPVGFLELSCDWTPTSPLPLLVFSRIA